MVERIANVQSKLLNWSSDTNRTDGYTVTAKAIVTEQPALNQLAQGLQSFYLDPLANFSTLIAILVLGLEPRFNWRR